MTFAPQPPWVCGRIGPADYQCTYPPVFLLPGDGVDLDLVVKLPQSYKPCSLENAARIVWPFGWSDANPADDFDWASATIPGKRCDPPKNPKTNLKMTEVAGYQGLPGCWHELGLLVPRHGHQHRPRRIQRSDRDHRHAFLGHAADSERAVGLRAGGPSYTCTHPPVVLNPGNSVFMWAKTSDPQGRATAGAASARSSTKLKITQARSAAHRTPMPAMTTPRPKALTPGENCEPIGGEVDLSITKEAKGCIGTNLQRPQVVAMRASASR